MKAKSKVPARKSALPFSAILFLFLAINVSLGQTLPRLDISSPTFGSTLGHDRAGAYQNDTVTFHLQAPDQAGKPYFLLYSLEQPVSPPIQFGGHPLGINLYKFFVLKKGTIPPAGSVSYSVNLGNALMPWKHAWLQAFVLDSQSPCGVYSSNGMDLRILPPKGLFVMAVEGIPCQYDLKNRCKICPLGWNSGGVFAQSLDLTVLVGAYNGLYGLPYFDVARGKVHYIERTLNTYGPRSMSPEGDFIVYQAGAQYGGKYELWNTKTGEIIQTDYTSNSAPATMCCSAYGRYIFLAVLKDPGGNGSKIIIIDVQKGTFTNVEHYWWSENATVACTPEGKYLAVHHNFEVHVLDRETLLRTKVADTATYGGEVSISPSANWIAWSDFDFAGIQNAVILHDCSSGKTVTIATGLSGTNALYSLRFSYDEKKLIFLEQGALASTLWIYDIPSGTLYPFWPSGPKFILFSYACVN